MTSGSTPTGRWPAAIAAIAASAVLAVVVLAALAGFRSPGGRSAGRLDTFGPAPAFVLTDQMGRTVRSDDLRGRVVLASFVFTSCVDVCPTLSARMQALADRLRRDGLVDVGVRLLSVTVDPERDTPDVLRAYAERYGADPDTWRFLTGPEHEVVPLIVQGFRLGVQRTASGTDAGAGGAPAAAPAGRVVHSGRIVLIDRGWVIRAYYDGLALDLDRVMRDVHELLG